MSLLVTTFSLILGLYFLRNNIVLSILISLSYFSFILWRFGKRKLIVVIAFFGLGVLIPKVTSFPNNGPDYGGYVIEARDNYIIFQSKFERFYVSSTENDFEVGDHLVVKGKVEDFKCASFESQFNFQEYLLDKGAQREIVPNSIDIQGHSLIKVHHFKKVFLSKFDENTASLLSAFLFNDKDYSSEVIKNADNSGVLYLFSLSGVYLNILFALTNYLLFLKLSRKKSQILTFIIFLPLAFFSFTKIGTLRVYSMYLLKYLNEFHFKRRKFTHIELVSLLALIFIAIDYHLVYQEAFYIGFLLSAFAPTLLTSTKCLSKKKRKLISSILFYLLLFPLRIRNSFMNPLELLNVFIIIPYNIILLFASILCLVLPLYNIINVIAKGEVWILEKMNLIGVQIPFGNWNGAFDFIFIGVVLLLIFYLEGARLRHVNLAVTCLISMITISIAPFQMPLGNAVYFVNVGQGDCAIIKNKNKTVMIDTGGYKNFDMASETLIPFMNKKKITHIDALILSHDDFDHSGAKDSLLENFTVKNVLTKPNQFPYQIGDLYIENLNTYNFNTDNDSSLVLSLSFINKRFLFMGDASTEVENKIMKDYDVDCDVLKVGHHGSKYSTSENFIKATSPEEAIISVGAVNYYGHPNDKVIENLTKYNVKIRRTDLEGTICYFSLFA